MMGQRVDHFLELMDLDSEEDLRDLSEMIQEWREQKMREEEARAWEDEQKKRAEILDKLRKEGKI